METDIDLQSSMGNFGWEELIGGFVIPYIFRMEMKLCSLEIFTRHVARNFHRNLQDGDLHEFDELHTYQLTQIESYLMNEINHTHCDSLYDHIFRCGDPMVELTDIVKMTQFYHDIHQKLTHGKDYDLQNCGILSIQLRKVDGCKDPILLPYVRLDGNRMVSISRCTFYKETPIQIALLAGINLQYMKFMCKVLQMKITGIGLCMPFEEIQEKMDRKQMEVREYWPDEDLWKRFYPPMESASRSFDSCDDSSESSHHDDPDIPTSSSDAVPANQQQQTATMTSILSSQPASGHRVKKRVTFAIDENGNGPSPASPSKRLRSDKVTPKSVGKSKEKKKKKVSVLR